MMNPLNARLQEKRLLLAPGIYDGLTALLGEQAGFEALYLSGASIAYSRLGRSDVGLVSAAEVADCLGSICERDGGTAAARSRMLDFDGLNQVIGTPELLKLGKKYDA